MTQVVSKERNLISDNGGRGSDSMTNWRQDISMLKSKVLSFARRNPGEVENVKEILGITGRIESVISILSMDTDEDVLDLTTAPTVEGKQFRKQYPKIFHIVDMMGQSALQEDIVDAPIGQNPLYCVADFYDAIAAAAVNLTRKEPPVPFNRFILNEAAREINPNVTLPACIACIRFWVSLREPIIKKDQVDTLFSIAVVDLDFIRAANEAWDEVVDCPLRLDGPRKFVENNE